MDSNIIFETCGTFRKFAKCWTLDPLPYTDFKNEVFWGGAPAPPQTPHLCGGAQTPPLFSATNHDNDQRCTHGGRALGASMHKTRIHAPETKMATETPEVADSDSAEVFVLKAKCASVCQQIWLHGEILAFPGMFGEYLIPLIN